MLDDLRATFGSNSTGRSWQVWLSARIGALVVGIALVLAMFTITPIQPLPDDPAIQAVILSSLEIPPTPVVLQPPPAIEPPSPPPSPKVASRPKSSAKQMTPPLTKLPIVQDRPTPNMGAPRPRISSQTSALPNTPVQGTVPRIATAPSNKSPFHVGQQLQSGNQQEAIVSGRRGAGMLSILRARECARLDIADRPADCPPNSELMQLLARERGPQYRPENAEGFSRNELAWRGVPPPCLENGQNSAVVGARACLRFGNVPSRVRSVREICEAKGLGGCAPAPGQAAVNAALEQIKRQ